MKKLFSFLVLLVLLTNCTSDNDDPLITYSYLGVDSVEMPANFNAGQTHSIPVNFELPNGCYVFSGFEMVNGVFNQRIVRVVVSQVESSACVGTSSIQQTENLDFRVLNQDDYMFRFLSGINDNGEEEFLDYTVQVN